MNSSLPHIILKSGRDASLRRRHPWVFSGAIERIEKSAQDGDFVEVRTADGEVLGRGHYAPGSIAVKMLSWNDTFKLENGIRERIRKAAQLRSSLGLLESATTTGFRLINAEGDELPGLVVDFYGSTAVIQFHSTGMVRCADTIVQALREVLGSKLAGIYDKTTEEGGRYLWGEPGPREFFENGHRFLVDWESGQKTGFFLDQRDNRALLKSLCAGRKVLNCFSYTGGFSIYALAGGAVEVVSVDSSQAALATLEENLKRNHFQGKHRSVQADCLQYLQKLEDHYDAVVLDPPAFVKHRGALKGGIKGYDTINHLAIKQIQRGGLLFTFSCSQLLERADFFDVVHRAALRAGREARILYELHQAACHPISLFHPEGAYLKGLILEIS